MIIEVRINQKKLKEYKVHEQVIKDMWWEIIDKNKVVVQYNLLFVLMMNELMEILKVHQIRKKIHVDNIRIVELPLMLNVSMSKNSKKK